jgi:hypothetical protein
MGIALYAASVEVSNSQCGMQGKLKEGSKGEKEPPLLQLVGVGEGV